MSCFRKIRGLRIPYSRQGLIRFTCLCYDDLPPEQQNRIDALCLDAGGEYSDALHAVMCSPRPIRAIAIDHHVSESTLYRLRARFYLMWMDRA